MYVFKKEYKRLLIDTIVKSRAWIEEACCAVAVAHTLLQWRCLAAGGQRGTETKCQRREGKGGREIAGRATRTTVHLTGQRIF